MASNTPATVCGFSFGRNLTKLNYPVEAAVRSVLPLCDRFIFAVGKSDDDTRDRVAAIAPLGSKTQIEIIDSTWPNVQIDGTVLSIEANKAMAAAQATNSTWGFYIQADEVVHEDDLPILRAAMDAYADDSDVKALLFRYLHFVLDYQTTDPWMYHKASRIVRLDNTCQIVGDACGPGFISPPPEVLKINDGYLDKNLLGKHVRWAHDPMGKISRRAARIFHYGWVKTPDQFDTKMAMVEKLWWGTLTPEEMRRRKDNKFGRFIDRYPFLKKYQGPHPAVMADRINAHREFARVPNRWLNPRFYAEILRHGFHG